MIPIFSQLPRLNCGARQRDQFGYPTSIEWQFQNPLVFYDMSHTRVPGFHYGRIRLNFDLFGNLAKSQYRIDHGAAADLSHNSSLDVKAESRQGRLQFDL